MTGCSRVFELLDTPIETHEPAEPEPMPQAKGEIRFDNVTFGYERHRPVLKDVDFTIRPGEKIGIVGRSGSGKTTLVNLISRFYDVESGRVLLDGVDVRELATGDLRRHVGVVLQEPFLFRGTICDNLIYGRPEASAEEAITAARAAQAHDFILHKPLGYDTWLGERGAGLSGGEKQRVSIARALLYDPRVLILDEATSSVDTESEKAIQEALRVLDPRPHHAGDRPSLEHALRLGPHLRLRPGPPDRAGHARRAARARRQVRRAGEEPDADRAQLAIRGCAQERWATTLPEEPRASRPTLDDADFAPHWLEPGRVSSFARARSTRSRSCMPDGSVIRSVFADPVLARPRSRTTSSACAPGTATDRSASSALCATSIPGRPRNQKLVREALARRYFLRRITGIDDIKLECGYLLFQVRTDQGPAEFTMRWTQSQVQDFGARGKVLLDVEDNRFLVPDVDELPQRERELLQRYVYW